MSQPVDIQDLIVVVADADAEKTMQSLLVRRRKSLNIRDITFKVQRFAKRDSGCYGESHRLLQQFLRQFHYAMVVFDRHGCGQEDRSRLAIEDDVEQRLTRNGWKDRSAAIVLDPELEAWVWSDSPEVDQVLGWTGQTPDLRTWLRRAGFQTAGARKPADPKRAMEEALRRVRKPRSPALFYQLAERIGIERCTDDAFAKFKTVLRDWFAVP